MQKAFFYDSLCGTIYRAMFAGLSEYGHAQWVNITPGEESKTFEDLVIDEELEDARFLLIGLEGETVQPEIVARLLGKVGEFPLRTNRDDMAFTIRRMEQFKLKWSTDPLYLEFVVQRNINYNPSKGMYSYWVEDQNDDWNILACVDGFNDLHELFESIHNYLIALMSWAAIPVVTKNLRIEHKLYKEVKKKDLGIFSKVTEIKDETDKDED